MILAEFEKKMSEMKIDEIETEVDGFLNGLSDFEDKLYFHLSYVERTGRWRENKPHANETFKMYLDHRFDYSYDRYRKLKLARQTLPAECDTHGTKFISKIIKKTGSPSKTKEFLKTFKKTHKKPDNMAILKAAEKQFPRPKKTHDTVGELRAEIKRLTSLLDKALNDNRIKDQVILMKDEQIEALKETILNTRSIMTDLANSAAKQPRTNQ